MYLKGQRQEINIRIKKGKPPVIKSLSNLLNMYFSPFSSVLVQHEIRLILFGTFVMNTLNVQKQYLDLEDKRNSGMKSIKYVA